MNLMTSVVSLDVTIERDEVLRFLGYPEGGKPHGRIAGLLGESLREARRLARPRGTFELLPVERAGELGLEPLDATRLVVGLVTIGRGIEDRATELLRAGAATEALLLDAAGSAAAEEAADRLGTLIVEEGSDRKNQVSGPDGSANLDPYGLTPASRVSCRISPGYGRWALSSQRAIFESLPHRELGVELLPTMLMSPRKSISFAMWLGADARPLAGLSGCARCELDRCRYRRT